MANPCTLFIVIHNMNISKCCESIQSHGVPQHTTKTVYTLHMLNTQAKPTDVAHIHVFSPLMHHYRQITPQWVTVQEPHSETEGLGPELLAHIPDHIFGHSEHRGKVEPYQVRNEDKELYKVSGLYTEAIDMVTRGMGILGSTQSGLQLL